ncbi:MAG: hypothetical protein V2B18_26130 [Pseudomonadota bacterium]
MALIRVIFSVLLMLVGTVSCMGYQSTRPDAGPTGMHTYGDSVRTEENVGEEAALPEWLDELLAGTPASEVSAGPEEAPAVAQAPEDGESAMESEPGFPKPPNISPLYTSPKIDGEGEWTDEGLPKGSDGRPLVYRTVYRPSVEYPNSTVHMVVFDTSRIKTRFFVGSTEPGVYQTVGSKDREDLSKIVAITNAMWMQRHSRGAGAIFRGQTIYPMVPGMATLVVYEDESVDILEWSNDLPRQLIKDARQLRHLIVKNGRVVDKVIKGGKVEDAEIGLGGFLVDNNGVSTMRSKFWFLANRTAFGVRADGNLVFAMGHHVSTKDMAKALVLAKCTRALHGDANIHNIVCNFYFRDDKDKVIGRDKLSPEQLKYTMQRYDEGYSKDFFAFYENQSALKGAVTRNSKTVKDRNF